MVPEKVLGKLLNLIVMNIFILALIIIVIGNYILSAYLKYLNFRSIRRQIPNEVSDVYVPEKYSIYQEYKRELFKLSNITSLISLSLTVIMIIAGFSLLDAIIRHFISNELVISIIFLMILGFLSDIISMPFEFYETFVIEQKYGFNTMSKKLFFTDKLKSYALALLIGVPLYAIIFTIYQRLGTSFWWIAWIIISTFSIVMSLLYSSVIVPMFNKQSPLQDGELKDKIKELAQKTDFNLDKVYVIDGSKRSTRANAYFSGLGSKKRIVLYDTLIKTQTTNEIEAVLAHEIGHYKKKHIIKGLIYSILQTGLFLFAFSLLVNNAAIYEALNTKPGFHIGIIVFAILFGPISFITSLASNYISRRYEFEADRFAVENASGEHLITALKQLSANNMSDLTPHEVYVKIYYSHPPLVQRIKAIREVP